MDQDKRELFLIEYKNLCKKHEMVIVACGCCDSPDICTKKDVDEWKYCEETFEEILDANIKHLGK